MIKLLPFVSQVDLLHFTKPIMNAGVRDGSALERAKRRHWWESQAAKESDFHEVSFAWDDYNRAFDKLHAHVKDLVHDAYEQGFKDGKR